MAVRWALAIAAMSAALSCAAANPVPAGPVPVPLARPFAAPQPSASLPMPSTETTGSLVRAGSPLATSAAASGALKAGLDALSSNDIAAARAIRDRLPAGSLARKVMTWSIALAGTPGVPSGEIAAAARTLADWPGLAPLRYNSERALYRENPPAAQVIAAFGASEPETAEGAIILTRALVAAGERRRAQRVIARLWREEVLDTNEETVILKAFSELLSKADHKQRMEMLLYRGRLSQARRASELAGAQSLYAARAAVIGRAGDAAAKLKAVHRMWQDDPSYLFARISHLRHNDRYEEAARLLRQAPRQAAALVDPSEWWDEQRIVSRGLAERGDYRGAYAVVAASLASDDVDRVEAAFHAGWYALRGLGDAATASRHFQQIIALSRQPLSLSRGYYWLGRAAEAGGPGRADEYYRFAARYQSTYYGQLAAARIGRKAISAPYPAPTEAERRHFAGRPAVQAIGLLEAAGHGWRADHLYRALARELTAAGELALLAAMAERRGDNTLSLQIGKIAHRRGLEVAALAFPIGAIPADANISGAGKALAYAIARQESAFNIAAVSPADARGLLQLLPGTARGVARRHGLAYSEPRLTRDAGYNATLGAHFLGEQLDAFDGSYILTFIAYNAGPRRVGQWIDRFGDPRGKPLEAVIDWIEFIPFTETRNYVQRVMENYQIYKARLGQTTDIVRDLTRGRS